MIWLSALAVPLYYVLRWFQACGLTDIMVIDDAIRMRGVRTAAPRPSLDGRLDPAAAQESRAPGLELRRWSPRCG